MPATRPASADDIRTSIQEALADMPGLDLDQAAKKLLECLGYTSDRTLPGQTGDVGMFLDRFPPRASRVVETRSERELRRHTQSIRVVFQITDEEIKASSGQLALVSEPFDGEIAKSYLFIAVELAEASYPRSRYAEFAREINKRLPMPAFVLFRTASGRLTLAFVHRRRHKREGDRQVLGSVSLLREIDPADPHRAYLDILAELSLDDRLQWMGEHGKPTSFDGLLAALLDTLDTQALNKRFYRELFEWFTRAVCEARFPTGQKRTLSPEEHVIRLITWLLFIWFTKEKGLVAESLFNETQVEALLEDYDREEGDSYYRAVLQNLFFATLNCELDERG